MTKIDLTFADHAGVMGVRRHVEVDMQPPPARDHLELAGLYASLEAALAASRGMVVQFVGDVARVGSSEVALRTCWVAAGVLGKRVLLLDDALAPPAVLDHPAPDHSAPHRAPARWAQERVHQAGLSVPEPAAPDRAITKVRGLELYFAPLQDGLRPANPLASTTAFASLLDGLRPVFDLILIVPKPMSDDPFARVFARHLDGSIIVVEAERTRGTTAAGLCDQLSAAGGVVLGTVLNRRRQHVPRWLRRWF